MGFLGGLADPCEAHHRESALPPQQPRRRTAAPLTAAIDGPGLRPAALLPAFLQGAIALLRPFGSTGIRHGKYAAPTDRGQLEDEWFAAVGNRIGCHH